MTNIRFIFLIHPTWIWIQDHPLQVPWKSTPSPEIPLLLSSCSACNGHGTWSMAMAGNKHHDPNDHPQCQNRLLSDYYIMGFSCSTSGLRGPRIWLMVCMANVWTSRDFPVPVVVEWPGEDLPNTLTPWRWGSSRLENYCHLKFGHVQGLCFGMIFVDHWVKYDFPCPTLHSPLLLV